MPFAIIYVFDKSYIKYFELSLFSLLQHNKEDNFDIVIFYANENDINTIKDVTKLYKKNFIFKLIQYTNYSKNKYTFNPFFRLDLFTLSNYKKIIFLDCDTLIIKNINFLFFKDIKFGACKYIKSPNLDYNNASNYFNAGVLLVDKYFLCDKVYKNLIERMYLYEEEEQLLNQYFKKDIIFLESQYNCSIYTTKEFNLNQIYIYHFISYTKEIYNLKKFFKNLNKVKNTVFLEKNLFLNCFFKEFDIKVFIILYKIILKIKNQYLFFLKYTNK
jgi:lipopolysaccharide biosynthesis glycosyltransferase